PFVACEGHCLPPGQLEHDRANCGRCGHACGAGQACSAGKCVCRAGGTVCGDRGADLQTDPHPCGRGGQDCPPAAGEGGLGPAGICVGGQCACLPGHGSGCSASATCFGPEHTYTTAGTCCHTPQVAQCCTETELGPGFAHCCTPGVDCVGGCPNGGFSATAG